LGFQVNPTKDRVWKIALSGSQNSQVHDFDHYFLVEGDCCKNRVSDQPSFEKISFVYLYKTYYAKSLLCKYCKEGASVVTHF
jgi:hypothetical protein